MKKEVLIAIIIGFGLGLIITFGIWSANKAIKQSASEPTSIPTEIPTLAPTSQPTLSPTISLTISSPLDNSISGKNSVEVKGITSSKAIVVLIYTNGEKILEADEQGQFSTNVSLAKGANEIKIRAYDKQGNEAEKSLTVVYSTAEI